MWLEKIGRFTRAQCIVFCRIALASSFFMATNGVSQDLVARMDSLAQATEQGNKEVLAVRKKVASSRATLGALNLELKNARGAEQALQDDLDEASRAFQVTEQRVHEVKIRLAELQQRRFLRLKAADRQNAMDSLVTTVFGSDTGSFFDVSLLLAAVQRKENKDQAEEARSRSDLSRDLQSFAEIRERKKELRDRISKQRAGLSQKLEQKKAQERQLLEQEDKLKKDLVRHQAELLELESLLSGWKTDTASLGVKSGVGRRVLLNAPKGNEQLNTEQGVSRPHSGLMVKSFGVGGNSDPFRNGVLFSSGASGSDKVFAVMDGVVGFVGIIPFFGNSVVLEHADSTVSLYGQMDTLGVTRGSRVVSGGIVGSVDAGQGLYFELRRSGKSINPETLISLSASK